MPKDRYLWTQIPFHIYLWPTQTRLTYVHSPLHRDSKREWEREEERERGGRKREREREWERERGAWRVTHVSRSFSSSAATGLRVYLGLGCPSGLPRWDISTTLLAPCSSAYLMVGSAATMLATVTDKLSPCTLFTHPHFSRLYSQFTYHVSTVTV